MLGKLSFELLHVCMYFLFHVYQRSLEAQETVLDHTHRHLPHERDAVSSYQFDFVCTRVQAKTLS